MKELDKHGDKRRRRRGEKKEEKKKEKRKQMEEEVTKNPHLLGEKIRQEQCWMRGTAATSKRWTLETVQKVRKDAREN
jgi:hypothetical protein